MISEQIKIENRRDAQVLSTKCTVLQSAMADLMNEIQEQEPNMIIANDAIAVAQAVTTDSAEKIAEASTLKVDTNRVQKIVCGGLVGGMTGILAGIPITTFLVPGLVPIMIHATLSSLGAGIGMVTGSII